MTTLRNSLSGRLVHERVAGFAAFAVIACLVGVMVGVDVAVLVGLGSIVALLAIALRRPTWFCTLALGSIFLSRFSVDAGGFNLRAEMVVGLVASFAILSKPRFKDRKVNATVLLLLACWMTWLVVVTFLVGPSFTSSLTVLVWLFLNLATVTYLVLNIEDLQSFIGIGVRLALITAVVGLALWSQATFGSNAWLVQVDPTYTGYAVYGTVFEANILASLVTLWSVIAISSRLCAKCSHVVRVSLILLTPFIAIATHTRIALLASVIVIVAALVLYPKSRIPILVLAVAMACIAMVSTVQLDQIGLSKFSGQLSLQEGTGKYRSDSWGQARLDIEQGGWLSSFSGLGANSFGQRHLDPTLQGTGARWYLGNLPLQVFYDGGLIAVLLVSFAVAKSFPKGSTKLALIFLLVYSLFAVSTSTLWLMQSWIFLAIVLVDTREKLEVRQESAILS